MAKLRDFLVRQLRASSLIEVITAMVIISTIFAIASMVFINVYRSTAAMRRLSAVLAAENLRIETEIDRAFKDEELVSGDFVIHKTVRAFPGTSDLLIITFEVLNEDGKKIAESKVLRFAPE